MKKKIANWEYERRGSLILLRDTTDGWEEMYDRKTIAQWLKNAWRTRIKGLGARLEVVR